MNVSQFIRYCSNNPRLFAKWSQPVTRGLRRPSMRSEHETASGSVSSWINLTMGGRDILVRAPLNAEGYAVLPVRCSRCHGPDHVISAHDCMNLACAPGAGSWLASIVILRVKLTLKLAPGAGCSWLRLALRQD
jgi:hypothetical protein